MKFVIDPESATNSDMEAGFAAWDSQGSQGKLYGAGFSNLREAANEGLNGCGIDTINETGLVKVDSFVYNADAGTQIAYVGAESWVNALAMTGTPSGAVIGDTGRHHPKKSDRWQM